MRPESFIEWFVARDTFEDDALSARVVPYCTTSFVAWSVSHVIITDWLVIELFRTEDISGKDVLPEAVCSVVKLNVPFVEQLPPVPHAVML
jgi:hypothetical protein